MLDHIKGDDTVLRGLLQAGQRIEQVAFADARDPQAPGGGHLLGRTVHPADPRITRLLSKVEQRAVPAAQLQDRGLAVLRKMPRDQAAQVSGARLQPADSLRRVGLGAGSDIMCIDTLAIIVGIHI